MPTLFKPSDRESLCQRLALLEPDSARQWGRMDPGQMLRHCSLSLADPLGERSARQTFLGKLVTPLIRRQVFGEKPFRKGAPTDPAYAVVDPRDLEAERTRLATLLDRLVQQGPAKVAGRIHPFFGRLDGDQWGRLVYKHLDHHLRQFGL